MRQFCCEFIQRLAPRSPGVVFRREAESEPVFVEAREYVQMHVADLLHGRFTIREKKVDALAANAAAPKSCGQLVGCAVKTAVGQLHLTLQRAP
jgi:hypothetical protein